ncbi:MAG TPA: flagellar basal body P-ring protein FlgI [Bacillota bacterium]|nr:flagellar basal body P-ring protein FlgI [Bacillota bacterium]
MKRNQHFIGSLRNINSMFLVRLMLIGVMTLVLMSVTTPVFGEGAAVRIKDIARLQGVRNNQLTGMGLVVGLSGTGDTSKANIQIVLNALTKLGYNGAAADFKTKNVAAVFITGTLGPYQHLGDTMDVQVASLGDAKSLQGGILLQSPLTGADGKVYAVAQGSLHIGGYNTGAKGSTNQKNITTSGSIPSGALVEREVPMQLDVNGKLRWALNNPDFTTAARLAQTINDNFAKGAARAIDMGLVEVLVPRENLSDPIAFIAEIETLPVTPDGVAKVVVNERTGTIVIGEKVKIAKVAVTHGNITVKVDSQTQTTQTDSMLGAYTTTNTDNQVAVNEENGALVELPEGTDIGTIVRALNAVGTTPQDIIAILVAIKEAGALYGVLEFV